MVHHLDPPHQTVKYLSTPTGVQQGNTESVPDSSDCVCIRDGDFLAVYSEVAGGAEYNECAGSALVLAHDVWDRDCVFRRGKEIFC